MVDHGRMTIVVHGRPWSTVVPFAWALPSSFEGCVEVPMMQNSVLFAFSFNLLFFLQRETFWIESLSWIRERQISGVVKEIQICVSFA